MKTKKREPDQGSKFKYSYHVIPTLATDKINVCVYISRIFCWPCFFGLWNFIQGQGSGRPRLMAFFSWEALSKLHPGRPVFANSRIQILRRLGRYKAGRPFFARSISRFWISVLGLTFSEFRAARSFGKIIQLQWNTNEMSRDIPLSSGARI